MSCCLCRAPEVALRKAYTESVDVYSFGIMVWQMARDRVPFKGMKRDEFLQAVVYDCERPKLDKSWPAGFSALLTACWHRDPTRRPSFAVIEAELTQLMQQVVERPRSQAWPPQLRSPGGVSMAAAVVGARGVAGAAPGVMITADSSRGLREQQQDQSAIQKRPLGEGGRDRKSAWF